MRSTALLLAALAGALVCAQDSTTGYVQGTTAGDSLNSELGITAPAESTSLQESATAAQKTSRAAQAPAGVTLPRQGFESLSGNEFIQRLKNIFLDPRKIWFLNI
ncbi:extracellular glycoprotein lacritin isoform X4 [Sturnira hondurensis]|uniref:extracellular glycoprotein lacritin isoform X4 n=1 Tax=Sturnira hondurensis TaxID=192404 RepID=UPI00187ABF73|nr:extracellular glycoprotein lacritin isoform X4 [Sturnira hondurensis]